MSKRKKIALIAGVVIIILALGATTTAVLAYNALKARPSLIPQTIETLLDQDRQNQGDGILIAEVQAGSPADEAGLARGDILLEVADVTVNDLADLREVLDGHQSGDEVQLLVLHGDDRRTLTATLAANERGVYLGIVPCRGESTARFTFRGAIQATALVTEVVPGSPAERAGLKAGDRILSLNGQPLDWQTSLADMIADHQPGDAITLTIRRRGGDPDQAPEKINVTLGKHPEEAGRAYLGISYRTLPGPLPFEGDFPPGVPHRFEREFPFDFDFRGRFRMPDFEERGFLFPEGVTSGVLVGEVVAGSPADLAGLQRRDVITALDDESIEAPLALVEAIQVHKPGDRVTLTVYRQGNEDALTVEVELGEHPEKTGQAYLGVKISGFIIIKKGEGEEVFPQLPSPRDFFDKMPFFERFHRAPQSDA